MIFPEASYIPSYIIRGWAFPNGGKVKEHKDLAALTMRCGGATGFLRANLEFATARVSITKNEILDSGGPSPGS